MYYFSEYKSPIGEISILSNETNLLGLWFKHQKYHFQGLENTKINETENYIIKNTKQWLNKYFSGKNPSLSNIPLSYNGTEFQNIVWKLLLNIKYGQTITYKELSDIICKMTKKERMSAQAVGGALKYNPILIIIPCHRVISKNGKLTGYAAGTERKKYLLNIECPNRFL